MSGRGGALKLGARSVLRDLRSGELRVLLAAVVLAVTAMSAVGFFTDRVGRAVLQRSSEVLAADLVVRSNRPISASYADQGAAEGVESAAVTSFTSVVLAGEASALADVEAASEGYPLRGLLRIADEPYGVSEEVRAVPRPGEAWADARLLARLDAGPGVELDVGEVRLRVTKVLEFRPDQGASFVDLAPTLLINLADVERTGLIQPGSRVTYRRLFAGEPDRVDRLRERLTPQLGVSERLQDVRSAGPQIVGALDRAERFLGLAALIGTLLSAVAVGMAGRRYALRQIDAVALMKCVGVSRDYVLWVNLGQLLTIGLIAGLLGVALGYVAQGGLAALLAGLAGDLPAPGLATVLTGFVLALVILAGFALPTLLRLRDVPPLRVLRRDIGPPPTPALLVYGLAVAAFVLLLYRQAGDPKLAAWVAGGAVGTTVALTLAGVVLVWLATRVRSSAGASWRYAVAGIARRGPESVLQVAAFGLGIMVLLLLTVIRGDLMREWRATLPPDAPNRFLINIQPDEAGTVEAFLERRLGPVELVPLVRARVTEIGGVPLAELEFPTDRGRRLVDREGNLSWANRLQADNALIDGEWWGEDPAPGLVSVEIDFAEDAGIGLGDEITFDVAGERFSARVASLRSVRWDSFNTNFFMVFSPGTLDEYPHTFIASVHVGEEDRGLTLDLVREHPSVTVIDIDAALEQVRSVMDQAALAVQYVFLFALLAGVVVLLAVVESNREERLFESAVLRTLGARRSQVFGAAAIEFTLIGLLAGVLAAAGANLLGAVLAARVFELDVGFNLWLWLAGVVAGVVIVGATGLVATRRVVNHPPVEVLRTF
jgi:putative ABC transport system permease protein